MQYSCLARVVRDGGFRIALIARFSAIPGHCASFFPLGRNTAAQIPVVSHHGCIFYVWHERVDILPSRIPILTKAIRNCVYRCHY